MTDSNVISFKEAKEKLNHQHLINNRNDILLALRDMDHPMAQKIIGGITLTYYDAIDSMKSKSNEEDMIHVEASGAIVGMARLDQEEDSLDVRLYQSDIVDRIKEVRGGAIKLHDLTDFVRFQIRYSTTEEKKEYLESNEYPIVENNIRRLSHEIFDHMSRRISVNDAMSPVMAYPLAIASTLHHPWPGERPYKVLRASFGDEIVINASNGDFQMDITFNFIHVHTTNGYPEWAKNGKKQPFQERL